MRRLVILWAIGVGLVSLVGGGGGSLLLQHLAGSNETTGIISVLGGFLIGVIYSCLTVPKLARRYFAS